MKKLRLFENESQYETAQVGFEYPTVSYVTGTDTVHYMEKPIDPFNGYEYVDLGLPSGTLWATMNVGANSMTDNGLYFAWGETTGYADASSGKAFSWNDYAYGSTGNLTKYNDTDGKTVLDLTDDAANVNLGGQWKIPSQTQMEELLNTTYVTNAWVTNYLSSGVDGRLFTSVADNKKTMFIPASGRCFNGSVRNVGEYSRIWSCMLNSDNAFGALYFNASLNAVEFNKSADRCNGFSVRGVIVPSQS